MPRATKSSTADNTSEKVLRKVPNAKGTAAVNKTASTEKARAVSAKRSGSVANKRPSAQSAASQEPAVKDIPVWDSWSKRHTITLMDAICTVHNIVANKCVLERLQEVRDPRTKGFNTHLKTLKDWVRNDPDVLPVEDRHSEGKVTKSTRILLAPFIQWVQGTNPFPGLDIPSRFFELTPPAPKRTEIKATQRASSPEKNEEAASDEPDEARYKTWAKLLIALAMKDYDLRLNLPAKDLMAHRRGKKGLYAPVSKFCTDMGITSLSDSSTVRKAFEGALEFLGQDFVDRLKTHAEGKERNASMKKAVQTSAQQQTNV